MDELESIVRALVENDLSMGCGDIPGEPIDDEHGWCVLCGEAEWLVTDFRRRPLVRKQAPHNSRCPWQRAVNWVAETKKEK